MNERQIRLNNEVLIYIDSHKIAHPKDIVDYFIRKGYEVSEVEALLNELSEYGLLAKSIGRNHSVCLSSEGKKALKLGYTSYKRRKLLFYWLKRSGIAAIAIAVISGLMVFYFTSYF